MLKKSKTEERQINERVQTQKKKSCQPVFEVGTGKLPILRSEEEGATSFHCQPNNEFTYNKILVFNSKILVKLRSSILKTNI